jgi:hypothetical protein
VLGIAWEPLGRLGAAGLLVPALLFAALPAAHALAEGARLAWRWRVGRAALLGAALLAAVGVTAPGPVGAWVARLGGPEPLRIGLTPEQTALVETIRAHTTAGARILWEDRRGPGPAPRWTALLPLWTERAFVGGLDPDAGIEYTAGGLVDQALAGRPLGAWGDAELEEYCRLYNVGWVVCRSPQARARFGQWGKAERLADLPGEEGGCLFRVRRLHSFALSGRARLCVADARCIVLADVVPEPGPAPDGEGQVVLSLHYQAGMRVAPGRVRLERDERSSLDAIPFVRLRVAEPVARVSITWEKR